LHNFTHFIVGDVNETEAVHKVSSLCSKSKFRLDGVEPVCLGTEFTHTFLKGLTVQQTFYYAVKKSETEHQFPSAYFLRRLRVHFPFDNGMMHVWFFFFEV